MKRMFARGSRAPSIKRSVAVAAGGAVLAALLATTSGPAGRAATTSAACPWLDTHTSVSQRVDELMAQMTVPDEINMVHGSSGPYVFYVAAEPSLCIPGIGLEDGPNGVADGLNGATQLPAGVSVASTFDATLADQYGQTLGAEQAGKGSTVDLGPTINIDRDPRFGRAFETFTEDPYLNGQLAAAEIEGIQSQGVMAQVKHLAVYNQETNRNTTADNVQISERALHEIYLGGFQNAVEQGDAASVMCSYNMLNNAFACANDELLNNVLDQLWGYPGYLTSDYDAMHDQAGSLEAGTDMEQPDAVYYGSTLESAVEAGTVSRTTLNTMVQRILTQLFGYGFFNKTPAGTPGSTVTTPAHVSLGNEVAEAGTVLLRDSGNVLPMRSGGSVAVIGGDAANADTGGGGSAHVATPADAVSPLQGIQTADPNATVGYSPGVDPVNPGSDLPGLPAVPSSFFHPTAGSSQTGLSATYYNNETFSGTPQLTRVDPGISLDYSWYGVGTEDATSAPPAPSNDGNTSVTWSGVLDAPATGTYTFDLTSNNASDFSIDGTQVIGNPGTNGPVTRTGTIHLVAGQQYTVKVDYASGYPMQVKLGWQPPAGVVSPAVQAAAALAKKSDAAVVVVRDYETEAIDRLDINLPEDQNQLIEQVAAANPNTIVVLETGAPVTMPWANQVKGIVEAWYPGQTQGTAIANVLLGKTDPGGHLPETFPTSLTQVPAATAAQWPGTNNTVDYSEGLDVGYRWYDAKDLTPLYPFGYGLSYTKFAYSGLHVISNGSGTSPAEVEATVTNVGQRTGTDVAQFYLGDPASTGEPPRELAGYQRVTLRPGQSQRLRFTVTSAQTWYWDTAANGWTQDPGTYQVYVGDSSALGNLPLRGSFRLANAVGTRQVSISAPGSATAGTAFTVRVTLSAGGSETLRGARLLLQAPSGWSVKPAGPAAASAGPGSPLTETFTVTPPAATPATDGVLHAIAELAPCWGGLSSTACLGVRREAGVTVDLSAS